MNLPLETILWLGPVLALLTTALTLPLWSRLCGRLGLIDDPGGRKLHPHPIPLAGGPAALSGTAIALLAALELCPALRELVLADIRMWFTVWAGAVLMTGVGALDDQQVLRPAPKFALQLAVALAVAAAGLRITLFLPHPVLHYALTAVWFLAVINAFNFMDNMNGLCSGLGIIAATAFALAAHRHGQYPEMLFSLVIGAALLGFLPANYPRARAFLGDAGSHLVGYAMAVLAILPSFHTSTDPRPLAVLTPLLVLAVPLADMAWMVATRSLAGQPFYVGDTNHLSHRLVRRGLSPPVAVALIWLMGLGTAALALLL